MARKHKRSRRKQLHKSHMDKFLHTAEVLAANGSHDAALEAVKAARDLASDKAPKAPDSPAKTIGLSVAASMLWDGIKKAAAWAATFIPAIMVYLDQICTTM